MWGREEMVTTGEAFLALDVVSGQKSHLQAAVCAEAEQALADALHPQESVTVGGDEILQHGIGATFGQNSWGWMDERIQKSAGL